MVRSKQAKQHRQIVRRVLKAMGYEEPTYGDFRLWDPILDWRRTARLMDQRPVRTALCHVLDRAGRIVRYEGKPVVVAVDVDPVVALIAETAAVDLDGSPTMDEVCGIGID